MVLESTLDLLAGYLACAFIVKDPKPIYQVEVLISEKRELGVFKLISMSLRNST
jgi:hypothetical protein